MLRYPVFTVVLILACFATAVAQSVDIYKVKVVTKEGRRIRGTLDDVSETHVNVGDNDMAAPWFRRSGGKASLLDVRKVVIRRSQRKNTLEGAIIGGGLVGFLTIRSSKKNGFSSPVVYGLNLAIAVGAGAGIGALIGRNIGPISRRTIRPFGQTPDEAAENLRRQLDPFTYSYQNDVLNRVPQ